MRRKVGIAFSDYLMQNNDIRKRGPSFFGSGLMGIFPAIVLCALFAFLLLRSFYLQVLVGSYYKGLSDGNRINSKITSAPRGIIFDRNGRPLVRNVPAFSQLDHDGKVNFIPKEEAITKISNGDKSINVTTQREYLYKDIFAHVLGYVGQIDKDQLIMSKYKDYGVSDFIGKMGLEQQYEELLKGKDGKILYEVDVKGAEKKELGEQPPQAGGDVKTTLDIDIQKAAADAFDGVLKGAAIVSDPRDGSIRALFSKPSFDTNLFTHKSDYDANGDYKTISSLLNDGTSQPFLNRAIGGVYPPGSTFKLITAVSGLDHGAIKKDTVIEDTGTLQVGTFSYGNWYFLEYGKKEGMLDVVGALKRSNDIFFYKTAQNLGTTTLAADAKKFGLGVKTGIDLPGEEKGIVPTENWKKETVGDNWYLGDTFHYGIGQGYLLTTPLQVNMYTTPFANGGILYKPHVIDGRVEVVRKNFIQPETLTLVRKGMLESCSPGGVAWPFFDFKIKNEKLKLDDLDYSHSASDGASMVKVAVGCKTGTAETTTDQKPHAWITVIAPFYHPEVVVTVLVENSGEGSNIAAPIARKILEKYFEKK